MDRKLSFTAEREGTLRDILRGRFSGRRIHFLREKGHILKNGEPVTAADRVKKGDLITLIFKETVAFPYPPEDLGIKIIYEDEDILVCFKPRGVPSMPAAPHFDGTLFNGLAFLRPNQVFRVVTRLDKDTSGLVLLAKNALSHSLFCAGECDIQKEYRALVSVCPRVPLEIDAPILSDGGRARRVAEGGKPAKTRIIGAEKLGKYHLLSVVPETGRTHQIRVHLAHVGSPIVGDSLYGGEIPDGFGANGQMLCCVRLSLIHPVTREKMEFSCPVDGEIISVWEISQ